MIPLDIHLEGDGCWKDLSMKQIRTAPLKSIALLKGGMQSGKSSVSFRIDLNDGTVIIAETSLTLFLAAARAFQAKACEEHEE